MSDPGEITQLRCFECGTNVSPLQPQCHVCGHPLAQPATSTPPAPPAPQSAAVDFGQLSGPHVQVQRGQSSDAGGGILSLFAGWVQIQGAVRSRPLGPMQDLRSVVFRDRQGREATLTFGDGTVWRVDGNAGGELLAFMLELERRLGVPGLVKQAPPLTDELASAVTPDVKRNTGGVVTALALAWILTMLTRIWSPLGIVLFGVAALCALGFVLGRIQVGPSWLSAWSDWCEGSPVIALSLACALVAGGVLGRGQAAKDRERAAMVQTEQAERDALAAREAVEAARAREAELAKVPPLVAQMNALIEEKEWSQAKAMHDRIVLADPASPIAAAVLPMIEASIAKKAETDRVAAFATALSQVPRIVADKVACESAGVVSATWKGLIGGTQADPGWEQVAALVPKLELCRRKVASSYARNTEESRAIQRASAVRTWERSLRDGGVDATVELSGREREAVKVKYADIDAAWIDRVTDSGATGGNSFLGQWEALGVRSLEFGNGRGALRTFRLEPPTGGAAARAVLASYGLADPLVLPPHLVATTPPN